MTARKRFFPLFWRIFLLFWLAMAVTVIVSNLVTRELVDRERRGIERHEGLRAVGETAIEIRERQGWEAVRGFLRQEGRRRDLHIALLATGNRSERLPPDVRERMARGWHRQRPAVIDFSSGYQLVAWPRVGAEGWLDPRLFRLLELVIAFGLITLACWWVARLVSRPLRHMESTAVRIAGGDTALRVDPRIANRLDEIGALATAFNGMTDRLCHLLERQQHLLRDISHDLRTPLTRQRIAIELASDGGNDPELMASILRQNERLEAMTAQILMLYQVSEQGKDIERESVRPVQLIQQVLGDAADYAEHQGVDCHLVADRHSQGVTVLGNPDLLQRAFDNVLQNALDHTPPGKVVTFRVSLSGDQVCIEIEDEGPGVADDVLVHLFEPFYRTDQARAGQGWGLGLAIAKDIVSAHDGQIEARNASHGGLSITVRLPVFTAD